MKYLCYRINENLPRIGGLNSIVQIDECRITTRKFHRGRGTRQDWIFGGIDKNTRNIFLCKLNERTQQTISPLIMTHIRPGSIIHSDSWSAYNNISTLSVEPPYQHLTVNHSQTFVDPNTGVHTNDIENLWKNLKAKFKRMCGVQHDLIDEYLSEFVWRYNFAKTRADGFNNMLHFISLQFSQ